MSLLPGLESVLLFVWLFLFFIWILFVLDGLIRSWVFGIKSGFKNRRARDKMEDIKNKVQQYLITKTDFLTIKDKLSEDELRVFVIKTINDLCEKSQVPLTDSERNAMVREIVGAVI